VLATTSSAGLTPAPLLGQERRHGASSQSSLPEGTISDSAAFARASSTALAGEGRAARIARASVLGVKLHMHRDVGLCSIEHDELTAVLLLRQQRGRAAQPVPRLWNGRCDAGRTKRVNYRIGGSADVIE
jgi:hypothetical protein